MDDSRLGRDPEDWGGLPKQAKGGTFAPADMPLIKNALFFYKDYLVRMEDNERNVSEELSKIASLLHRINRISA